ncbi:Hypothetical protein Minf_0407 [Methylacidiphilum infernorum V4]|uniref:Uncharacterized protein n=1 Tax=Methylacidiphilum infernorum (isolate V4) TaxID=481448 RepID=B3DYU3_METI4|nr:Hypothetical protein Minf_0407 [Methylacidiphilum infernorum V4]
MPFSIEEENGNTQRTSKKLRLEDRNIILAFRGIPM